MTSFNPGTEFKTRVAKGSIKKGEYVIVSHPGDWRTKCKVKNDNGDEEEYESSELIGFAILEKSNTLMDIIEDGYDKKDKDGNEDVMRGHVHISPNVRSGLERFTFWDDCRYSSGINNYSVGYRYPLKELSDEEVVNILLNEILYEYQPSLQSVSCVGTSKKGIDNDPNYHNGYYVLCNEKEYTMTYCWNSIQIREGIDGGWYHDKETAGRTLYEGKIDFQRLKQALIKKQTVRMLNRGRKLFDELPELQEIIINHIKDKEEFKLSTEF